MADQTIARRYAKALLDLVPAHQADDIANELSKATQFITASELLNALSNPVFTPNERKAVFDAVMPRLHLSESVLAFFRLLLDKSRFAELALVDASFRDLVDERSGRVRVQVESAEDLTPAMLKEVVASLESATGKKVLVETTVNPDLIGGLVARVGSTVYDASIRTKLLNLRKSLISAPLLAEA